MKLYLPTLRVALFRHAPEPDLETADGLPRSTNSCSGFSFPLIMFPVQIRSAVSARTLIAIFAKLTRNSTPGRNDIVRKHPKPSCRLRGDRRAERGARLFSESVQVCSS